MEQDGWDGLLFTDTQNLSMGVFGSLYLAASATSRLELGTAVTNLITRHPAVMVSATLYHVSGGRAHIGVGRGDLSARILGRTFFLDPWMFHQANLRAYDGSHTLLTDLLDRILKKYDGRFDLAIQSLTQDGVGRMMARRMGYNEAGVTASVVPGKSITLKAQKAAKVPVTGLQTTGAERYGGQYIAHVSLDAGESITLALK